MTLYHTSDIHLSFQHNGEIKKPMETRVWSMGSKNYIGYLDKLASALNNLSNNDTIVISGDITHDRRNEDVIYSLAWISEQTKAKVILIRGNHDLQWKLDYVKPLIQQYEYNNLTILAEEEVFTQGNYTFGVYSPHQTSRLPRGSDNSMPWRLDVEQAILSVADRLVEKAKEKNTVPVFLSHYPFPVHVVKFLGQKGVKLLLSGHIHCTNGKNADGNDWTWYDLDSKPTDMQTFNGCTAYTGTTDVLLNLTGEIIRKVHD
jgi:predicted phosphohydrolase